MFGFGGRKKYESNVAVLLRDLDQNGHISPHAASSKTANEFRLTGCSEHETALYQAARRLSQEGIPNAPKV
jgi:hypothetical protein